MCFVFYIVHKTEKRIHLIFELLEEPNRLIVFYIELYDPDEVYLPISLFFLKRYNYIQQTRCNKL